MAINTSSGIKVNSAILVRAGIRAAYGISAGGEILPPIPANALFDYYYPQTNLALALTDRVSGTYQTTNSRGTDTNQLQTSDGSIQTFLPAEQGFDVSVAATVEPLAVTGLPYSNDFENAAWAKVYSKATGAFGDSPLGLGTSSKLEVSGGHIAGAPIRLYDGLSTLVGEKIVTHRLVKPVSLLIPYLSFSADRSGGAIFYNTSTGVITDQTSGNAELSATPVSDGFILFVFSYTATADDTVDNQFLGLTNRLNVTADPAIPDGEYVEIAGFNAGANFNGSYIEATGAPAQRDADKPSFTLFTEKSVWIDDGSDGVDLTLGEYTDRGDYVGGVNPVVGGLTFESTTGAQNVGKYYTLLDNVTDKDVGGGITSPDGSVVAINSIVNENTILGTLIKGNWESFQYPANLKWDRTTSAYFNSSATLVADTATVAALHTAAGGDVSLFPTATMMPANGWAITVEFIYGYDIGSKGRVLEAKYDADNKVFIFKRRANPKKVKADVEVGNVKFTCTVVMPSNIELGDHVTATLTLTAANQMALEVTNHTKAESEISAPVAAAAVTNWPSSALLGTDDTGANMVSGKYIRAYGVAL